MMICVLYHLIPTCNWTVRPGKLPSSKAEKRGPAIDGGTAFATGLRTLSLCCLLLLRFNKKLSRGKWPWREKHFAKPLIKHHQASSQGFSSHLKIGPKPGERNHKLRSYEIAALRVFHQAFSGLIAMVVPSEVKVSKPIWSFGWSDVLDCQVRRYLDEGESFHWQDLLMLSEMSLAALISEIYLAQFLPFFGLVSHSSSPIAPLATRPLVFLMAPVSYLLMYAAICGSIHYIYTWKYPEEGQRLSIQKKPMADLEMQRAIVFSIKSILSVSAASSYAFYAIQGWTNLHWGWPSFKDIPCFLVAYILVDISAYVVHRMLHRPWWYRYVHKAHHLWKSPNAFVVSALHPAEFLSLTLPTLSVISALPMSAFSATLLLSWIFTCNAIESCRSW